MKNEKWLVVILVAIVGYLIYRNYKPKEIVMVEGNPGKLLEAPKTTMMSFKVIVPIAGTPQQFPQGKPVSDVRLSTEGNTGSCFLGTSYADAKDTAHRFAIATGHNIPLPFEVSNLNKLWVDVATGGDGVSILCEIEEQ